MANNLDQNIADAAAAGMSYGKYMATKPVTETKKEEERKPLKTLVCAYCGKEFPVYDNRKKKYCSEECRSLAMQEKAKERKKEQENQVTDGKQDEKTAHFVVSTEPVTEDRRDRKIRKYRKAIHVLLELVEDLMEEEL